MKNDKLQNIIDKYESVVKNKDKTKSNYIVVDIHEIIKQAKKTIRKRNKDTEENGSEESYEDEGSESEESEESYEDEGSESEESEESESEESESEESESDESEESGESGESEESVKKGRNPTRSTRKSDPVKVYTPTDDDRKVLEKIEELASELGESNKSVLSSTLKKFSVNQKNTYNKMIKKREQRTRSKNLEQYRSLIKSKNTMADATYFESMDLEKQNQMLEKMNAVNKLLMVDKPYRIRLYELDIPDIFKATALKKINMLKYMDWGSGEFYKIKTWVDTFMLIPFNKFSSFPITRDAGIEACNDFMCKAKDQLDEVVYGLADAKIQVLQLVAQWITNPEAIGTAIAIKGPPGTGKTTLIKNGISKILGREFAFIALGGATDSSFLEGHSITYEGSTWGKIVDVLIQCQSMNIVFYFDELDKISDTPRGEEITGILTHLTDVTQNGKYHDKFFSEIDFDLSKCMFIFSYNDESKVNPILLDRMYRIHTKGYDKKEKCKIANDHLLPRIREQLKWSKGDVLIEDEVINYLIDNYTQNEAGVRNLKRCLEIIHTKINLYLMWKADTPLYNEDLTLKIEFPFNVTTDIVQNMIKREEMNSSPFGMYM